MRFTEFSLLLPNIPIRFLNLFNFFFFQQLNHSQHNQCVTSISKYNYCDCKTIHWWSTFCTFTRFIRMTVGPGRIPEALRSVKSCGRGECHWRPIKITESGKKKRKISPVDLCQAHVTVTGTSRCSKLQVLCSLTLGGLQHLHTM